MPRLFIGCRIPDSPALRAVVRDLRDLLGPIRFEPVSNWHVTVKFLGEVERELQEGIERITREEVDRTPPLTLRLQGLGAFPGTHRPSILWVGIEPDPQLTDLAARLDSRLTPLGFPAESRPYRPHLTLVRLRQRPPAGLYGLLEQHAATDLGLCPLESVELYESLSGRDGVRYEVRNRFPLSREPSGAAD